MFVKLSLFNTITMQKITELENGHPDYWEVTLLFAIDYIWKFDQSNCETEQYHGK